MGGKVFSSGPDALYTPRMVPEAYSHTKRMCFAALEPLFPIIESPIEAPEKATHGDIDILVCLEGSAFTEKEINDPAKVAVWAKIDHVLEAVRSYHEGKSIISKNIAIPWPKGLDPPAMMAQLELEELNDGKEPVNQDASYEARLLLARATNSERYETGEWVASEDKQSPKKKDRYVQVDVRLCLNRQELDWRCFKHNHGDLFNILGATIRPFGLTADEEALYIRIPEIEYSDRKKARVFLTNDPVKVLNFLGLSHEHGEMEKPFSSVEALFEYAASCRWFMLWPEDGLSPPPSAGDGNGQGVSSSKDEGGVTAAAAAAAAAAASKRRLKANDRARMKQRAVFARWVEKFVPSCLASNRFVVDNPEAKTRAAVRDEARQLAFSTFPGSEERYAAQLAAWRKEKARIFVKNKLIKEDLAIPGDISHVLPALQENSAGTVQDMERGWRGALRSALVRILVDDDDTRYQDVGIVAPKLRDEDGVLVVDDVKGWIEDNWEEVGHAAWRDNCARAAASYRAREERRKQEAGEDAEDALATGLESKPTGASPADGNSGASLA